MDKGEAEQPFAKLREALERPHHHVVALAAPDSTCLEDYADDDYNYDYTIIHAAVAGYSSSDLDVGLFLIGYTGAHEEPTALGHAANLVAPPDGSTPRDGLIAVWIVEGHHRDCPLTHGDDEADGDEGPFLESVLRQEPYWQASLTD